MKVAVFGNYGVQNLGDDLILTGLLEQLKKEHAEVIVFCGQPEQVRRQFRIPSAPFFPGGVKSLLRYLISPSYRHQIRAAFQTLSKVDEVWIGGGGILVDRHPSAVFLWWRQLKAIAQTEKPFRFVANSFELKSWWSRFLLIKYLRLAKQITVRDQASQRFTQSLGLSAELVDDLSVSAPIKFPERSDKKKKICLALCQWGLGSGQLKGLRSFLQQRLQEGFEIIGLAFQLQGDDDRKCYKKLQLDIPIFSKSEDIFRELNSCQLLVGMRFHSLVLAERFKTPFIAIAYQEKIKNFMKDRGLDDQMIDGEKLNADQLQKCFQNVL